MNQRIPALLSSSEQSSPTPSATFARFAWIAAIAAIFVAGTVRAAPEAHILRIDPRAGVTDGKPVLTTVVEVVQFKRLSEVLQPCANETGFEKTASCWSQKIETPGALWSPFPFPDANAQLLVKVNGADSLTKFQDKKNWGQAKNEANVGTAWLIALDASSGMGARYAEAQKVAYEFIQAMQPNDLIDLMIFDDRQVIKDTKWKTFKDRNSIVALLQSQPHVAASHGSDRALFSEIKTMTRDGFNSLGNSDQPDAVPLHQAMVLLSDGSGRGDPESASPSADVFHEYLDKGRFDENNPSMPKTPLPVISIWFPNRGGGLVTDLYKNNDAQFMQALANPEIGGFFDIVQEGQGDTKGKTIITLVKNRFDAMWLVHWRLSCLNPTVEQSFNLIFQNTKPQIAPDGSFQNVPLGVDPTQWPLDVDFDRTSKEAAANPIYPGGKFRVYGEFCWTSKEQAEAYFIPAGTRPNTQQTNSRNPTVAKQAMQSLIAQNMRGQALDTNEGFAEFQVPDDQKVLEGTGENTVARVVIYDNKAHRASAIDEKSVLSLKATKKPLNMMMILAVVLAVIAIILLVLVVMRSGGGGKSKRGGSPPPGGGPPGGYGGPPPGGGYGAPPGGGYGAPPGGYGGPPPGAGPYNAYGAAPALASAPAPASTPAAIAPRIDHRGAAVGSQNSTALQPQAAAPIVGANNAGNPAVVEVRCPSCAMMTMATVGQLSVCFSCGQPLPANVVDATSAANGATFPLTGAMGAVLTPPPNPYANGAPNAPANAPWNAAKAATIRGELGQFLVRPGGEVRIGRDPAQCPIFLANPA